MPQALQARQANLGKAHTSLGHQLERLTQAYLEAIVGLEEYCRRRAELETRLDALSEQAEELERQANQLIEVAQVGAHITDFCARVSQSLAQATFEQGERTHFYQLRSDSC